MRSIPTYDYSWLVQEIKHPNHFNLPQTHTSTKTTSQLLHIYQPKTPQSLINKTQLVNAVIIYAVPAESVPFRHFVESAGYEAMPPHIACIGPVTEKALSEAGFKAEIVADKYSIAGLVDAIVRWNANGPIDVVDDI